MIFCNVVHRLNSDITSAMKEFVIVECHYNMFLESIAVLFMIDPQIMMMIDCIKGHIPCYAHHLIL